VKKIILEEQMSDKKLTIISETRELGRRIVEVNEGLSKWLINKVDDYDCEKDILRLIKFEKQNRSYIYQYEILKGENGRPVKVQRYSYDENHSKTNEWILRTFESPDIQAVTYC
jgi:hypothetical protein